VGAVTASVNADRGPFNPWVRRRQWCADRASQRWSLAKESANPVGRQAAESRGHLHADRHATTFH